MSAGLNEERFERFIGHLLRIGVTSAAVVVLAGGIWHFLSGPPTTTFSMFQGEPRQLRNPVAILTGATRGDGRTLIQLGLLILIATPIARVLCSLAAFALYRDWLYVGVTALVLLALLFSLSGG